MKVKVKLTMLNDCALFVAKCGQYEEDVDYCCGRYVIEGKSLMGVTSVGLGRVCEVRIHTDDIEVAERFRKDMEEWIVE